MRSAVTCLVAAGCLAAPALALAWSPAGHMVSAVIAFDDLAVQDAKVISRIADVIRQHPDRSVFELATGDFRGDERSLRLMMECARWPDDARTTAYDHPTWHFASRPVVRPGAPRPPGATSVSGQAIEALELNFRVAANPRAPGADRALALCWLMHIAADMHQPLHAAALYSAVYPDGDAGGNTQFVADPEKDETVSLHWYWDSLVVADADPGRVLATARALKARHPRASLTELDRFKAREFAAWSYGESLPLAGGVYAEPLVHGSTRDKPAALPPGYADAARQVASRRITIAGLRLADLLREIAREREGNPD